MRNKPICLNDMIFMNYRALGIVRWFAEYRVHVYAFM